MIDDEIVVHLTACAARGDVQPLADLLRAAHGQEEAIAIVTAAIAVLGRTRRLLQQDRDGSPRC